MQPSPPSIQELRDGPPALITPPDGLPTIPGGWAERAWNIAGTTLKVVLPAVPDAFLEDPGVIAAHERDGYMPYWAYVWPASLHMARAVLARPWPTGTPVLELGAGIGLVGLAAAHAGYPSTITDYDPVAVDLAVWNARRAGLTEVTGRCLDWREPFVERYSVLLGCELLYEDRNHELLIHVLDRMLAPNGTAWFGDGGRVRAERFTRLLTQAGYSWSVVDEHGQRLPALQVGRYQLLQVFRNA